MRYLGIMIRICVISVGLEGWCSGFCWGLSGSSSLVSETPSNAMPGTEKGSVVLRTPGTQFLSASFVVYGARDKLLSREASAGLGEHGGS